MRRGRAAKGVFHSEDLSTARLYTPHIEYEHLRKPQTRGHTSMNYNWRKGTEDAGPIRSRIIRISLRLGSDKDIADTSGFR
jgi:hypothetical protein